MKTKFPAKYIIPIPLLITFLTISVPSLCPFAEEGMVIEGAREITSTAIAAATSGKITDPSEAEGGEAETEDEAYEVNVIAEGGTSLRKGAGTEYGLLGESAIPAGVTLEISDVMQNAAGEEWGYTQYGGMSGWVSLADTEKEEPDWMSMHFLRIDSSGRILDDEEAAARRERNEKREKDEAAARKESIEAKMQEAEEELESELMAEGVDESASDSESESASEEDQADDGATEGVEESTEEAEKEEKKKGGFPFFLIFGIIGVLLLIGAAAALGLFLRSRRRKRPSAEAVEGEEENAAVDEGSKGDSNASTNGEGDSDSDISEQKPSGRRGLPIPRLKLPRISLPKLRLPAIKLPKLKLRRRRRRRKDTEEG